MQHSMIIGSIAPSLLNQALTHSSSGETGHNERLEFLGDAVLGLIISQWLFENEADFDEGRMSQLRAAVVREESLANVARQLNLGKRLHLGRGEEKTGGRTRTSLLADTMEAVIAALYLSVGWEKCREYVSELFHPYLKKAIDDDYIVDYKSQFQEQMQASGVQDFQYQICRSTGPDHDKTFWVQLKIKGETVATGKGKTKKQAEQDAARLALAKVRK